MSARSRLSLSVDEDRRIIVLRYFGDLEGSEVNLTMMDHLSRLSEPWTYDSIVDLRRHNGTVTAAEIEELGMRWALLAQGRDTGRFTAVISQDPLVRARFALTEAAFPFRRMDIFDTFDEGIDWIDARRVQAGEKGSRNAA